MRATEPTPAPRPLPVVHDLLRERLTSAVVSWHLGESTVDDLSRNVDATLVDAELRGIARLFHTRHRAAALQRGRRVPAWDDTTPQERAVWIERARAELTGTARAAAAVPTIPSARTA